MDESPIEPEKQHHHHHEHQHHTDEQNISFTSPTATAPVETTTVVRDQFEEHKTPFPTKLRGDGREKYEKEEEEEEEFDEELERRLLTEQHQHQLHHQRQEQVQQQHHHHHQPQPPSTTEQRSDYQHPLDFIPDLSSTKQEQERNFSPNSPLDSMDSNDFVKLEKPHDLYGAVRLDESNPEVVVPPPKPVQEYDPEVQLLLTNKDEEITPSDDIAAPIGDDLSDFAPSPQDAAHDLADRSQAVPSFEQFLASSGANAGKSESEMASHGHHHYHEGESAAPQHRVGFRDDDEQTYRRHGPLTVGQPTPPEEKEINLQSEPGFYDNSETPDFSERIKSTAEDASAIVGEFASKMSSEAQEGAFKAKEVIEHGASQAKDTFDAGASKAKDAVEDLLGFDDDKEKEDEITSEFEHQPPPRIVEERNFSIDQPESPITLSSVRPPTPPKPRAADAPETPPILDLGGPVHPHHHYPTGTNQRKPSLKVTPNTFGMTSTGVTPIGSGTGKSKIFSLLDFRRWDQNVLDLIYWRDVKKSGIVFGVTLALLISLATFNIIAVLSHVALVVLGAAIGYRIYTHVMSIVHKTEQKNPFQPYLEQGMDFPQDRVHEQVDVILKHTNDLLHQLKRLFFVEDLFDTIKFALLLWALTYVGAYFSGMALIVLAFVGLFTLPKVYELYQPQIDNYYGIVESNVKQASDVARNQLEKVPFFRKQKVPEKQE